MRIRVPQLRNFHGLRSVVAVGALVASTALACLDENLDIDETPATFHGLYATNTNEYAHFWPSGDFASIKPSWNTAGEFDAAATRTKNKKYLYGRYETPTGQDSPSFPVALTYANGTKDMAVATRTKDGWHVRMKVSYVDEYFSERNLSQLVPSGRTSLNGHYYRQWSHASGDGAFVEGMTGLNLHAGGVDEFKFLPQNRFSLTMSKYVATDSQVGNGTSTVATDASFDKGQIKGEGTYSINGILLRFNFDNGKTIEDVFHVWSDRFTFGDTMALKKN
jgi:hypothetical protein